MAEQGRKSYPRTISHGLPDELETTIGERIAAERKGARTRPAPGAPERARDVGNTDEPVAPREGGAQKPS
ncbi:hypothetical protein [Anaeromyxobacter oryzae]|uniref:Uncharacterized protein n=1 Tax=Anaeromyxobacter oryzae TaxID=2918170 RepID=A0ABN6MY36_9BACT|nr:hypothetical protein [Anaeromyxobacter oryzae]BDG05858.1 hypothetical protein AMOR_48540 [Anaeromyxobacter oryzae]